MPETMTLDLDSLTVGDIELIEDELNARLDVGRTITFMDVIAQFDDKKQPDVRIPLGKLLRAIELASLRKDNPAATWEDAGKARITGNPTVAVA